MRARRPHSRRTSAGRAPRGVARRHVAGLLALCGGGLRLQGAKLQTFAGQAKKWRGGATILKESQPLF